MGLAKFPDLRRHGSRLHPHLQGQAHWTSGRWERIFDVHYVVDGSIQRSDQSVRVTAQLIDAITGRQIWADRYDRQVDNIFAIRDDITRSIAGVLGGAARRRCIKAEIRTCVRNETRTPSTPYDYLMRGLYEYYK